MRKLLTIVLLFISVGVFAQVDSTTYFNELDVRIGSGRMKRDSLLDQFKETGYWLYRDKGHFTDSTALVTAHPSPVQGEYASVGNGFWFVVNNSNQWVSVSGSGGSAGVTDGVTIDGVGSPGDPYAVLDGGISTAKIAANAVDSTKIEAGAVKSGDIGDGEISLVDMAPNSVDSTKIVNGGVDFEDIQNVNSNVIIGRNDAGVGSIEPLTPAEARTLMGVGPVPVVTQTSFPYAFNSSSVTHSSGVARYNLNALTMNITVEAGTAGDRVFINNIHSTGIAVFSEDGAQITYQTEGGSAADFAIIYPNSWALLEWVTSTDARVTVLGNGMNIGQLLDVGNGTPSNGNILQGDGDSWESTPLNIQSSNIVDGTITGADIGADEITPTNIDPSGSSENQVISINSSGNPQWSDPRFKFNPLVGTAASTYTIGDADRFGVFPFTNVTQATVTLHSDSLSTGDWTVLQRAEGAGPVVLTVGGSAQLVGVESGTNQATIDVEGGMVWVVKDGFEFHVWGDLNESSSGSGLTTEAAYTLFGNTSSVPAVPVGFKISALGASNNPQAGAWLPFENSGGQLRKVEADDFLTSLGINPTGTNQMAFWNSSGWLNLSSSLRHDGNKIELFGEESTTPYGATTPGGNVLRFNDVSVVPLGPLGSGGVLYVLGTSLWYHDDAGNKTDLTAATGSSLASLTDVNPAGFATNHVLKKSATDWISGLIQSNNISNGAVGSTQLADGGVSTVDLADNSVNALKITTNAVGADEISSGAVGSDEVLDASINTIDLADNSITGNKIAPNAVSSSDIGDLQVATSDLANSAVTSQKIADGTVSSSDIADGTIATIDVSADAITGPLVADDAINSEHYVDGSIDEQHIANLAVTTNKLGDNSVTSGKIVDNTIANNDIAQMAANSLKGNVGVIGDQEDITPASLTEEPSPSTGMWIPIWDVAGNLEKVDPANLGSGGGGGGTAGVYKIITNGATQYDIVFDDSLQYIWNTNASVTTDTLPTNANAAFPIGYSLVIYAQNNNVELELEGGVDLNADTTALGKYVVAQGTHAVITKVGLDEWNGSGFASRTYIVSAWVPLDLGSDASDYYLQPAKYRTIEDDGILFVEFAGGFTYDATGGPATSISILNTALPSSVRPYNLSVQISGHSSFNTDDNGGAGNPDVVNVWIETTGHITVRPVLNVNVDEGTIMLNGAKYIVTQAP